MIDPEDLQTAVESLQSDTIAIIYYLYRSQGCPMGNSLKGLIDWSILNIQTPFNYLAEREENQEDV